MAESKACFRDFDLDRITKAVRDEKNVYILPLRAYDNFVYSTRCKTAGGVRSFIGFVVTAFIFNYIIPVADPISISFGVGVACSLVPPLINTALNKKRKINYHHLLNAIIYFKEDLRASKTVMSKLEKGLIEAVDKEKRTGADMREKKIECMNRYAGCLCDSINKFDDKLDELTDKLDEAVSRKGNKKKYKKMSEIIDYISGIREYLYDLFEEARYAADAVIGECTYEPNFTRGNKLFKYADEERYNQQLMEYKNQQKNISTEYSVDNTNSKTAERNI